tara:strand:- start:173 stop:2170 length:1998 start_codon:yes stop_codon:yes gene_type:complete
MSLTIFPEIPLSGDTSTDYDVVASNSNTGWFAFNRFSPSTSDIDPELTNSFFHMNSTNVSLTLKSNTKNIIPKSLLWGGAYNPSLGAGGSFRGGLYTFALEGKAVGSSSFSVIKLYVGNDFDSQTNGAWRTHTSQTWQKNAVKNGIIAKCDAYSISGNPQMIIYTSASDAANQTGTTINNPRILELSIPATSTAYTEFRISGSAENGYFTSGVNAKIYEIGVLGWNQTEATAATTLWNDYQTRETRIGNERSAILNAGVTLENHSQSDSWDSMETLVPVTFNQALDLKAVWDFHLINVQAATPTLTNNISSDTNYITSNGDPEYLYSAGYATMLASINNSNVVNLINAASNNITSLQTEHAGYLSRIQGFVNSFALPQYSPSLSQAQNSDLIYDTVTIIPTGEIQFDEIQLFEKVQGQLHAQNIIVSGNVPNIKLNDNILESGVNGIAFNTNVVLDMRENRSLANVYNMTFYCKSSGTFVVQFSHSTLGNTLTSNSITANGLQVLQFNTGGISPLPVGHTTPIKDLDVADINALGYPAHNDKTITRIYIREVAGFTVKPFSRTPTEISNDYYSVGHTTKFGTFTIAETIQYEIGLYRDRIIRYLYIPDTDDRIRLLDDYVQLYGLSIAVRLYMGQAINFGLSLEEAYEMYLDRHTGKQKHPLLLV